MRHGISLRLLFYLSIPILALLAYLFIYVTFSGTVEAPSIDPEDLESLNSADGAMVLFELKENSPCRPQGFRRDLITESDRKLNVMVTRSFRLDDYRGEKNETLILSGTNGSNGSWMIGGDFILAEVYVNDSVWTRGTLGSQTRVYDDRGRLITSILPYKNTYRDPVELAILPPEHSEVTIRLSLLSAVENCGQSDILLVRKTFDH